MKTTKAHVMLTFEELPDSGYRVPSPGDYFMWEANGIMHYCADTDDQNGWSPAHEYRLFKVVSREER